MKIKYFSDTDTALIEFTKKEISETKEISLSIAPESLQIA
ncbi:DUF2283 domain-containing protein [bacterium]|nr:DUF2283 domain-containing protein [bacterium]